MKNAPTHTGASSGVDTTSGMAWSFEEAPDHWRNHDVRERLYWQSRSREERLAQAAYYRERVHGDAAWPTRWLWVEPFQ